jgi:hypothetical protein
MLNVAVPSGVKAPLQPGSHLWLKLVLSGATLALLPAGCAKEVTRVRLEFKVENEAFRPEYIDVVWWSGKAMRNARVPNSGPFLTPGPNLGSALISLSDSQPVERRFVARGMRGGVRVSGASSVVQWRPNRESSVNMVLGCYDDPEMTDPVPGCPGGGTAPDGGAPDSAGDTSGDAGDGGADLGPRG